VLQAYEKQLYDRSFAAKPRQEVDLTKPLRLHEGQVESGWLDYNGHMNESRYLQVFGDATDALLRYIGVDSDYLASGLSYYTVETHIMHLKEVRGGERLHVTTQVLGADEKRMHLFHTINQTRGEAPLASAEQMLLHVDTKQSRAVPARTDVFARLKQIADAHTPLPKPAAAGRHVGSPRSPG
jgi:carnitine 3-dehydrogenase